MDLKSSARRDRQKVQDLENELHKLRTELRQAEAAPVPSLPVEVREPEELEGIDDAGDELDDSGYEVIGTDEEGLEIIYVGQAAEDHSVSIPGQAPPPPASAPPSRRDDRAVASRIPGSGSDRLAVTDGAGPTVAQQLRGARVKRPVAVAPSRPARSERAVDVVSARAPSDPKAQYRRYYEALKAENYTYAATGFRNFIERFPSHELADNARYWLGESFYAQRSYRAAMAEFHKVVSDYPRGNKVPDAMLKIGYCYIALKETDRARAALREVIELHPKSHSAKLAARRLESL